MSSSPPLGRPYGLGASLAPPAYPGAPGPSGVPAGYTPWAGGRAPHAIRDGFWMVDPGNAKQSEDWVFAGSAVRPSAPLTARWLSGSIAVIGVVTVACGALLLWRRPDQASVAAGAFLAGTGYLLYAGVLAWRDRQKRQRHTRELAARSAAGAYDPTGSMGADGTAMSDEAAAGRQAWEAEIPLAPPPEWPDRPLVIAIGDGVGTGLRSAEISRLATEVAWKRTYHYLHALTNEQRPVTEFPWLRPPPGWAALEHRHQLIVQAMVNAFADANEEVLKAGEFYRSQDPAEVRSVASTLSLVVVDGQHYFLVHVGDCSVYHVEAATGQIRPRQLEHNKAAEYALQDPPRYAERHEEARRMGWHNQLTRWVGMSATWAELAPQVMDVPGILAPGDALVLCSDGVDKHVLPPTIARVVCALDAPAAARHLVELSNYNGGADHISLAVLNTRPPTAGGPAAAIQQRMTMEAGLAAFRRYRAQLVSAALLGVLVLVATPTVLALGGAATETVAPQIAPTQVPPTLAPTLEPTPPGCDQLASCTQANTHRIAIAAIQAQGNAAFQQINAAANGAATAAADAARLNVGTQQTAVAAATGAAGLRSTAVALATPLAAHSTAAAAQFGEAQRNDAQGRAAPDAIATTRAAAAGAGNDLEGLVPAATAAQGAAIIAAFTPTHTPTLAPTRAPTLTPTPVPPAVLSAQAATQVAASTASAAAAATNIAATSAAQTAVASANASATAAAAAQTAEIATREAAETATAIARQTAQARADGTATAQAAVTASATARPTGAILVALQWHACVQGQVTYTLQPAPPPPAASSAVGDPGTPIAISGLPLGMYTVTASWQLAQTQERTSTSISVQVTDVLRGTEAISPTSARGCGGAVPAQSTPGAGVAPPTVQPTPVQVAPPAIPPSTGQTGAGGGTAQSGSGDPPATPADSSGPR